MRPRYSCLLLLPALSLSLMAWAQGDRQDGVPGKVPSGAILVKGAWSSASDSTTPVPGGRVANGVFSDPYFGISYLLPSNWTEKYKGPPPSDSGRYVLAQLSPAEAFTGPARGSIEITAQDMFFTPASASNAAELVNYVRDHLQAGYEIETPPIETRISGRPFTSFAYWSPRAQLHFHVLVTEIRCHAVQIVLTSRDANLLADLILDLNRMKLPAEASSTGGTGGGAVPVCIKDYAHSNIIARVDPIFTGHKFNSVPVRIIIAKDGTVRHIHFLSAFPDQTIAISAALSHWKFKTYLKDGRPVEVETGILFGQGLTLGPH